MRRVKIFSGSSHVGLAETICERLGTTPGQCELRKFANGETSVGIGCSVRDQDVFVVQSGSSKLVSGGGGGRVRGLLTAPAGSTTASWSC